MPTMRSTAGPVNRIAVSFATATAVFMALPPLTASAIPSQIPDDTWQTNGRVRAIVYRENTVYLAGEFTRVISPDGRTSLVRNHVAAFNARTGAVTDWNPNADGPVYALAVSPGGGRIYLGGAFHRVHGETRHFLAVVGPKKGTPKDWAPTPSGKVRSMTLWKDGARLFIGGGFRKVNGQTRLHLAKLYTDKPELVRDWQPRVFQVYEPPIADTCRPRCPANVAALALSRDGEGLYLGGTFGLVNGASRNSAAEVDLLDGRTTPWNPDVYSYRSFNQVLDIAPYGSRVLICGNFFQVGGRRTPNMVVVDAFWGNQDRVFDATTDGAIPACKASKDGTTLYVGGHFGKAGGPFATETGQPRLHLAAFRATTGALLWWNPKANSVTGVFAMARTGGRLAIGGDFTRTGGRSQARFAQFTGPV